MFSVVNLSILSIILTIRNILFVKLHTKKSSLTNLQIQIMNIKEYKKYHYLLNLQKKQNHEILKNKSGIIYSKQKEFYS